MGPLAGQILLESLAIPGLLAGLVMAAAKAVDWGRFAPLPASLAVISAIGITYIMAFGWPETWTVGARPKVLLSAAIGLLAGLALHRRLPGARLGLIIGAILLPLWIGLPALLQMRPESLLLLVPIAAAFAGIMLMGKAAPSPDTGAFLILLTLALGTAGIAAFAKALSFAELSLALASALAIILAIGPIRAAGPASIMAASMLSASISALLLYSTPSLPALLILLTVIGANDLTRRIDSDSRRNPSTRRVSIFCLLPLALAILIARIDAGSISIY